MLGKRKADSQLTPEGAEQEKSPRFSDNVENFPVATADEIAKRPPLVAKRRGGQPEITNPASDQPSDDPTKPPAVVQPVGPAPAVVKAAESAKKEEETQKSSDTPVTDTDKPETKENSGSDNTTSNTENKPTMELAEPKEASKSAFPAFDFSSSSFSSPFTSGQKSIFSSGESAFSFTSDSTTSKPFSFTGFGDSPASKIEFNVPTGTPSSISESAKPAAVASPVATTTGEEDENTVFTDTVRVYHLGNEEEQKPSEKEASEGTKDTDKAENDSEKSAGAKETADTNGEVIQPKKKWLERGRGELKLNVQKNEESKSRIIVRRERTHQLVINMRLFSNITCEKASDTAIRIVGFNQGPGSDSLAPESYLIRQRNAKNTSELFETLLKYKTLSTPLGFGGKPTNEETPSGDKIEVTTEAPKAKEPQAKEFEETKAEEPKAEESEAPKAENAE